LEGERVSELLALLAAVSFALGTTLQQRGTLETDAAEGDPRFLREILREPVWLVGALLQAAGWVLQAAALDRGSLVVVQSLCTLSLVFALPLGAALTRQRLSRRSVAGACATVIGLIAFVAVGEPNSGVTNPAARAWWTASIVVVGATITFAVLARRSRGPMAATLYATAAGIGFGFQAAVTKEFMTVIGHGLGPILGSWTTYALVASALVGFALQQSALKTGYLAPAMAASNASTLIVSVVLGVAVFDETLVQAGDPVAAAVLGLLVATLGVVLLALPERADVRSV
jgi:drug/metabolite transporter (DMT)-like permease